MTQRSRRELLKALAAGSVYVSPVIATLAAPSRLMAQGPSGMDMWMFCDYFPVLCMIFGGSSSVQEQPPWTQPTPGGTTVPGTPGFAPPPGAIPPPGGLPPGSRRP